MRLSESRNSRQATTSTNLQLIYSGEQYRHLQNTKQSRERITAPRTYNAPTLPARLTALEYESAVSTDQALVPTNTRPVTYSGPAPPKSWKTYYPKDHRDSVEWRVHALSLMTSHLGNFVDTSRMPSLTHLCLQLMLLNFTNKEDFRENVVSYVPSHLRRDMIRYCAIHSPLPNWRLDALFSPQGNADGEILIMGPAATLNEGFFIRRMSFGGDGDAPEERLVCTNSDWETEEMPEAALLSLILVSTPLPRSILFSLPPSITYLVLIDLPVPIPVHRLPKLCPLLVLLDLSYNNWLEVPTSEGVDSLKKTAWGRWKSLEVVGLRGCHTSDALVQCINARRWDDVNVIAS